MDTSDESVIRLFSDIQGGSRRSLARGLSLIESTASTDRVKAFELLELCGSLSVVSRRIGLTGSPGVGKSTLVERFGLALVEQGHRVAVLAVDPSSKRTGGSILGDKVRMPQLSLHERAFVRPSPSRLALGGATITTRDAIVVCEAAGYDTILVETVGVGQSETDVAEMVDLFMLLLLPTAGDEVQGIKRGIMEVAHALVVTKADIDPQATRVAVATFTNTLRMMWSPAVDWQPSVVALSSTTGNGMPELVALVERFFDEGRMTSINATRHTQRSAWFNASIYHEVVNILGLNARLSSLIEDTRLLVMQGTVLPSVAVHQLFSSLTILVSESS